MCLIEFECKHCRGKGHIYVPVVEEITYSICKQDDCYVDKIRRKKTTCLECDGTGKVDWIRNACNY